ncbi:MAG TPA: hypothetical protein VFX39_02235, partial [Gemmatimonadaceae bacterium]|nr:hypothetical protein [Gemmatimonadaceae bacterium]
MPAPSPSLSSPGAPTGRRRPRRLAATAGILLASLAAGACTEDLETTAVCADMSTLCPEQKIDVEQVVLNPVVLDTSLTGVPLLGNEPWLALLLHGDEVDTRAVVR